MDITLEPYPDLKKQEIVAPINKEYTLFGSMKKKGSCKLFHMDPSGEVRLVTPERTAVLKLDIANRRKDGVAARSKVKIAPGVYIQTLNMRNAIRKLKDGQAKGLIVSKGEIRAGDSN